MSFELFGWAENWCELIYFHKVDSRLDTVLVVHDQENQFGKSPKAAKIEFEQ